MAKVKDEPSEARRLSALSLATEVPLMPSLSIISRVSFASSPLLLTCESNTTTTSDSSRSEMYSRVTVSAATSSGVTLTFLSVAERSLTNPSVARIKLSPSIADCTVDSTLNPSTAKFAGQGEILDIRALAVLESKIPR
mgnify:FL=1